MSWWPHPTLIRLSASGHTDSLVNAVSVALRLASARYHELLSPEHLLAGMVAARSRSNRSILSRLGLTFNFDEVNDLTGPVQPAKRLGRLKLDSAAEEILANAKNLARELGHNYVGTEHIVLALLRNPWRPGADFLLHRGITPESILLFC